MSKMTYFHRCFIAWQPINTNRDYCGNTTENIGENMTLYLLVLDWNNLITLIYCFIQKNTANSRSFLPCLIRVSGIKVRSFFYGESDMSCKWLVYIAQCSPSRARRDEVTSPGLRLSSSIEKSGTLTFRNSLEKAQLSPKTEVAGELAKNFSKFDRPIR